MNYFKKIYPFAKPYARFAYLNIFFNILYAFFSALSFVALIPMIKVLFDEEKKEVITKPVYDNIWHLSSFLENYMSYYIKTTTENSGPQYTLTVMIIIIIALFLLKNLFNYWAMYFITFLRNGVLMDIRNAMYKKTIELPLSFFSEKRKGDVMARISSDVLEIQHSFLSILELIVREPLTILFTIITMFVISTKLTLFVFVFIPISGYIISIIGKSLKKQSDRAQQEQGYFLSIIEETLGGLKVIKGFTSEKYFNKKFYDSTNRFNHLSNRILNRQNLASPASEFLGIAVIAVLLWFGGRMVLVEETLSGAAFIAYMGLAYNILTPAKAISKAAYGVKKGNAAAERVMEILEQENPITDKPGATDKNLFDSSITIEN